MAVLLPRFQIKITEGNDDDSVHCYVRAVSHIKVNLSSQKPADSAEVRVPGAKKTDLKTFQEGQGIQIKFGYEGEKAEMRTVFTGEITWVSPNLPLVIKAEDGFHAAKHKYFSETYCKDGERLYYSEIARDVLAKAGLDGVYIPLAKKDKDYKPRTLEFEKQTVAQAMARLSEEIGWVHFWIPGKDKVYFGPNWPYHRGDLPQEGQASPKILCYRIGSGRKRSTYDADKQYSPSWGNIISAGSLRYRTRKPFAKVICNLVDREQRNTSVKGEYPEEAKEYEEDTEGQEKSFTRPYSFDQGKEQAEEYAKKLAKEKYHQLNSPQYEGSFTTFGNPFLSHSHRIWLASVEHSSRDDYYDCKSVTFDYSPSGGFRMTVEVRKPPQDVEEGA